MAGPRTWLRHLGAYRRWDRPSPFVVCHPSLKGGWLTDDIKRSSVPPLFVTKRGDRVDARRAAGGQPDGQERHQAEEDGHRGEDGRVLVFHAEQESGEQAGEGERGGEADGHAGRGPGPAPDHYHPAA